MEPWSALAESYRDRTASARRWKAAGGRVAGFMSNTVPVELIAAAGFMPVQLAGVPGAPTPLADRYMEDLFDPIVRSAFQRILAGEYAFLDLIVLPRTSDSVQRLYYYLDELRRTGAAAVPEVLLYDLLHTPWASSAAHNRIRTGQLKAELERLSGQPITDERLATEIAAANRRRAALRDVVRLRRQHPPGLAAEHALHAFDAWRSLDGESFDAVIDAALAALPPAPTGKGPRVMIAGSALDNPDLHRLVEAHGGSVVGDDHGYGEPMIGPHVAEEGDPLQALVEHYHRHVPSTRTFPSRVEPLRDFALEAGAEAVVFYFYAEEEALTWEYPAQRRALEAAGVKVLALTMQPYPVDATLVEGPLAGFLSRVGAHV